jgi:cytochrome c-type biogenesis protein CcmH
MKILASTLLTILLCFSARAAEPLVFESEAQEQRFNQLILELRCLVCQNQSLADSDAPLAHDLRAELYDLLQQGKNDDEIKQFLVQRYGDFVLYRPPLKGSTLLLWIAPGLLLVFGAGFLAVTIRKRNAAFAEEEQG